MYSKKSIGVFLSDLCVAEDKNLRPEEIGGFFIPVVGKPGPQIQSGLGIGVKIAYSGQAVVIKR